MYNSQNSDIVEDLHVIQAWFASLLTWFGLFSDADDNEATDQYEPLYTYRVEAASAPPYSQEAILISEPVEAIFISESSMLSQSNQIDAACEELITSKTFKRSVMVLAFLGTAVGIGFLIKYLVEIIPCENLMLENLTNNTLSFTYGETADDDHVWGCSITPWKNVTHGDNIHLKRGELLSCTFYTDTKFKLHTSAHKISINGEDDNGCTMSAKKDSAKCTFRLYKNCPTAVTKGNADEEKKRETKNNLSLRPNKV